MGASKTGERRWPKAVLLRCEGRPVGDCTRDSAAPASFEHRTTRQPGNHSKEPNVSLQTIVGEGLADRINQLRAGRAAVAQQPSHDLAFRLPGASTRALETGLALAAIAVAVLLGLGH